MNKTAILVKGGSELINFAFATLLGVPTLIEKCEHGQLISPIRGRNTAELMAEFKTAGFSEVKDTPHIEGYEISHVVKLSAQATVKDYWYKIGTPEESKTLLSKS